jgi:hypothetical protein
MSIEVSQLKIRRLFTGPDEATLRSKIGNTSVDER